MTARAMVPAVAVALALTLAGCQDTDAPFGPLPPGLAEVVVQGYYEYDLQAGFGGADQRAEGLRFQLVLPGSGTPVAEGVGDELGVVLMEKVPVGTYDLRVDPGYLADSLVVTDIDTTRVTLVPGSRETLSAGVTPVSGTLAEAREMPVGRRLWFDGVALNRRGSTPDQSVHVLGSDGAAVRVVLPAASSVSEGDSVRVLGRAVESGADRHLVDGVAIVVAAAEWPPVPVEVEVGEVSGARGGALDAQLVVVRDAVVTDTLTVPFVGRLITITGADADGAEADFVALLRIQNGYQTAPIPGTPVLSLTGLLTPDPNAPGRWLLVPRSRNDDLFGQPPMGGG